MALIEVKQGNDKKRIQKIGIYRVFWLITNFMWKNIVTLKVCTIKPNGKIFFSAMLSIFWLGSKVYHFAPHFLYVKSCRVILVHRQLHFSSPK